MSFAQTPKLDVKCRSFQYRNLKIREFAGGGKNNASRTQQQTQPNKLAVTPEQI